MTWVRRDCPDARHYAGAPADIKFRIANGAKRGRSTIRAGGNTSRACNVVKHISRVATVTIGKMSNKMVVGEDPPR